MKGWWRRLSRGDRLRVLAVSIALTIGGYGLLLYPAGQEALRQSENMIKRRLDRIAKRTVVTKQSDVSPVAIQRKLELVEEERERLQASLGALESRFAPIQSSEEQQRLLLEIANLARQSGIGLISLESAVKKTAGPGQGAGLPLDRRLGRPLLELRAHADYWALTRFLEGLNGLEPIVSAVRLVLRARSGEEAKGDDAVRPAVLDISLWLVI